MDALLTTSEAVLQDNPHLGVRLVKGKDPLRVVIDSQLRTEPNARVYRDKNVLVATTSKSSERRRKIFQAQGIELFIYKGSQVPLKRLLKDLYFKSNVFSVMVEAGSSLVTSLLRKDLADTLILFFAPIILGQGKVWFGDLVIRSLNPSLKLKDIEVQRFDDDIMISGMIPH